MPYLLPFSDVNKEESEATTASTVAVVYVEFLATQDTLNETSGEEELTVVTNTRWGYIVKML